VYIRDVVGTIEYVHGVNKGQLRTSVQSILGKSRYVQVDANNNTSDVNRSYKWSTTNLWAKKIFRDLLRFGFMIFMVIGGQGCPQILVDLCWLPGMVFPSEFLNLRKL
jgi:hypothetical protein